MNVFWLLILAHLIADFPLQSDKIYAIRLKYKWGSLLHIGIYFVTNLIVAFPLLQYKVFWFAVIFLTATHLLEDWLKITLTQNKIKDSLLIFLVDQLIHIFFIWLAFFILFDIPEPEFTNRFFTNYYFNQDILLILIGLVFSAFGGGVFIYFIRKCIHSIKTNDQFSSVQFPKIKKRRIGYIERFIATGGVILGGWYLIFVPIAFLPRLIIYRKYDLQEFLMVNLLSGLLISILSGIFVHWASSYFA